MNPGYGSGGYSDFTTVNSPANIAHMIEEEAMNTVQAGIMNPPEMFNLEAGMELLAFPNSKNNMRDSSSTLRSSSDVFKGFLAMNQQQRSNQEEGPSSTSAASTTVATANYHHHPLLSHHHHQQEFSGRFQEELLTNQGSGSLLLGSGQDYPQQLHRPSRHGLSLSLSPHNPSEIRIQHFESTVSDDIRYGVPYRTNYGGNTFRPYDLKNSKYLLATQELLYEFCNLGTRRQLNGNQPKKQPFIPDSTTINPSLYTVDFLELQKRKCKLVAMREEVDRRYKIYCEQMRAVVASFEVVAGEGAADVYSSLACRAMSKHFRCLRDGILDQVKAIKKVLGEKDSIGPVTTKGETPRLRLLDQSLRQQKAYQSMGMMENHPWRPQRGLPERSVSILRSWLFEHFLHPYPSDVDKHVLARQTGLSRSQVSNWFINARVRLWKPMIEDMYVEEAKDQDKESIGGDNERSFHSSSSFLQSQHQVSGEMPPLTSLHDSDSLSSIINGEYAKRKSTNIASAATITTMKDQNQQPFGGLNYEFSSYPNGNSSSSSHQKQYPNNGSVSLTLGLHQHSAANPPSAYHPSLFFPRENNTQLDECHPLQFSSLEHAQGVQEGSSGFGTQYRSGHLVGTQLLHDFVG